MVKAAEINRAGRSTFLLCPHCQAGSVTISPGSGQPAVIYPPPPAGSEVKGLPDEVKNAWREARVSHNVAAYTASEVMCRKILMHVAVDKAGSSPGEKFYVYVNDLDSAGYVAPGLKPVIDQVRDRGNGAAHELPQSTEAESRVTLQITEHLLRTVYEMPLVGT